MTAGKKKRRATAAQFDGVSEGTGQVVQLQSSLDRQEILSCQRWHALIQISTALLASKWQSSRWGFSHYMNTDLFCIYLSHGLYVQLGGPLVFHSHSPTISLKLADCQLTLWMLLLYCVSALQYFWVVLLDYSAGVTVIFTTWLKFSTHPQAQRTVLQLWATSSCILAWGRGVGVKN